MLGLLFGSSLLFIKTNFSEGDVNFDKADKTLIKDGKKLPQTLNLMGNFD